MRGTIQRTPNLPSGVCVISNHGNANIRPASNTSSSSVILVSAGSADQAAASGTDPPERRRHARQALETDAEGAHVPSGVHVPGCGSGLRFSFWSF